MSRRILRRLYADNRIRIKRIKVAKVWKSRDTDRIKEEFAECSQNLARIKEDNYDIVYIDEVMFTKKTYLDRSWSIQRYPLECDGTMLNMPAVACAVAVSEQYGLDLLMMFPKSVNKDKFATFIKQLRAKYPFRRMALYMDQLSVHTSKATARILKEQRFEWVFNPPYSPFANPIEEVFSVAK